MTIQIEINRIKSNVSDIYDTLEQQGLVAEGSKNTDNLNVSLKEQDNVELINAEQKLHKILMGESQKELAIKKLENLKILNEE